MKIVKVEKKKEEQLNENAAKTQEKSKKDSLFERWAASKDSPEAEVISERRKKIAERAQKIREKIRESKEKDLVPKDAANIIDPDKDYEEVDEKDVDNKLIVAMERRRALRERRMRAERRQAWLERKKTKGGWQSRSKVVECKECRGTGMVRRKFPRRPVEDIDEVNDPGADMPSFAGKRYERLEEQARKLRLERRLLMLRERRLRRMLENKDE